jgi:hypothetical protein
MLVSTGVNQQAFHCMLALMEPAPNGTVLFQNVNSCCNTNSSFYLETSGGQNSNLYLNVAHFSTPVLIRYLWQPKTVVFLHRCLIHAVLLNGQIRLKLLSRPRLAYSGSASVTQKKSLAGLAPGSVDAVSADHAVGLGIHRNVGARNLVVEKLFEKVRGCSHNINLFRNFCVTYELAQ